MQKVCSLLTVNKFTYLLTVRKEKEHARIDQVRSALALNIDSGPVNYPISNLRHKVSEKKDFDVNEIFSCSLGKGTNKRLRSLAATIESQKRPRMGSFPLEKLPAELLEHIFLLSLNLNLLYVSRRTMHVLSSEYVFNSLSRIAFVRMAVEGEQDADLQSMLLRSRFMTKSKWLQIDHERVQTFLECLKNQRIDTRTSRMDYYPDPEYEDSLVRSMPLNMSTRLPPHLLLPPWNDEDLEMLKRLIMLGATIPQKSWRLGDVANEALRHAVEQDRLDVVKILTSWKLMFTIEPSVIRTAVLDRDHWNKRIIMILARRIWEKGVGSAAQIDPDLIRWAERKSKDGEEIGTWLILVMERCVWRRSTRRCKSGYDAKTDHWSNRPRIRYKRTIGLTMRQRWWDVVSRGVERRLTGVQKPWPPRPFEWNWVTSQEDTDDTEDTELSDEDSE